VVSYRCHGGLDEAVAPITVDDLLLGFVMIGQFRTASRPPKPMLRAARQARLADRDLSDAFMTVPMLGTERAEHVIRIFGLLVGFIARLHLVGVAARGAVHPLLRHMAERPELPLSLDEAAAMVHRSPSTVSHQFRRTVGRGFKRTQIELRLKRAEQCLREYPDMQVSEVAAQVGYANAHYFSRLFRKHRGVSPTDYRRGREPPGGHEGATKT